MIASCRSPEWCNIVTLLDDSKHFFKRYGGHRQAAGFTIETAKFKDFEQHILEVFKNYHDIENLPKQTLNIECILPIELLKTSTLDIINQFRPFGIGNRKPLFILENLTVKECRFLGQEEKHLALTFLEIPSVKCIMWKSGDKKHYFTPGNIISPIVELEANEWQGKITLNVIIKDILL
jgi:single-stranded-DNA-specific exonuclease